MINLRRSTASIASVALAVAVLAPAGVADASGKAGTTHAKKRSHHVTRVHKSAHRRAHTRRPNAAKPKVTVKGKGKVRGKGKSKTSSARHSKARLHRGKPAHKKVRH
ncbi:MAG TPA: hypothetical protein VG010_12045 [Solirubrobacteraceae bacterium]|jgi:hypothetical protein|nr:hypothetical protein [Solirubrobacteraceae bacterium]